MSTHTGTVAPPIKKKEENEDEEEVEVDADMEKLSKFTALVSPLFLVYGLLVVILTILSIVGVDKSGGWVTFMFVILATVVFSIIAALGVYKWGTVQEQIDLFKQENIEYARQIDELKTQKDRLSGEVTKLQETTNQLNRDVDALKGTLSQYDELRSSLASICGQNEDLNRMLNEINDMYSGMEQTIIANTKAGILAAYYDVAFMDNEEGMNKNEYRRFLGRLDKKTREIFKGYGSFEDVAGADGVIDKLEFQKMVDELLSTKAEEFVQKVQDDQKDEEQ